jgi:pimeloyl-ACP methyl ester carboxylesterase
VTAEAKTFVDELVSLPGRGLKLAVRQLAETAPDISGGPAPRPFVLVHGLASNARLWDGVAVALAAHGHRAIAVDLRGHGHSDAPDDGYDTETCADDLAALLVAEELVGDQAPIVVGQSWGGNVVLSLAARRPGLVAGVGCVDGGWTRLRETFPSFAECWAALAPPRFDAMTYKHLVRVVRASHFDWPPAGVEGALANLVETPSGGVRARLSRSHHQSIVRSLYEGDPATLYPKVKVPVLLVPATGEQPEPGEHAGKGATRAAIEQALATLPDARVRWYPGADHDLHAQFPERLAADLLTLLPQEQAVQEQR